MAIDLHPEQPSVIHPPIMNDFNEQSRAYWEPEPCGTGPLVTSGLEKHSLEWFERVEEYRYAIEPFIHSIAQFTRHHGKRVLEVGVGAGTDHLQWARAGAECWGVDLTDAAIHTTRERLARYGFTSNLRRVDAESLPFADAHFDVVYSWGVIHHSSEPARIVDEIHRVLRPGGTFIGMMYARHSPNTLRSWVRRALLRGRPWHSMARVIREYSDGVGAKAYTPGELRRMLGEFHGVEIHRVLTTADRERFPGWMSRFFPPSWGSFIGFRATR